MRRPGRAVRLTAVGVVAAYSAILYFAGVPIDAGLRRAIGYLPALAGLVVVVWDLWVWRWPLVWRSTGRPRLDGLWEVELRPTADSHIPEGGNRGPIIAYLVVRQTYWSIALQLFTVESSSISRSFFWDGDNRTGTEWLTFVYDNTPMLNHQHRSGRHLGTCTLQPGSRQPAEIRGAYFTDRYTAGDMKLTLRKRDTSSGSFEEAVRSYER